MQHIYISEHNSECTDEPTICSFGGSMSKRDFCRPVNQLFYHHGEFYFITHNSCIADSYYSNRDFNQSLFKALMDSKKVKYFKNERTYLEEELKQTMKEGVLLHRDMKEINQIYTTCYNRTYCIYTVYSYAQYMANNIGISDDYVKAKEYINGDTFNIYEKARFKDEIDALYMANNFYDFVGEKTVLKSIDELTKLLKK